MRKIEIGENLNGKTLMVVRNSNGHNYKWGEPFKIKKDVSFNDKERAINNLDGEVHNNILYIDLVIVTPTEEKAIKYINSLDSPKNRDQIKGIAYFLDGIKVAYTYTNSGDICLMCGIHKLNAYIVQSPTSNCQLSSIKDFATIIQQLKDSLDDFINLLYKFTQKPLIFVDVRNVYIESVKKIFKGYIISENPYISSNGNSMCTFIINIKKYLENLKSIDVYNKKVLTTRTYTDINALQSENR